MEPKIVQRRRALFWEIFSADNFHVRLCCCLPELILTCSQSLALGRPPSIRLSYVDTELPDDDGDYLEQCMLSEMLSTGIFEIFV